MGIIKTAMMSGAAMYGVHQLAKTAQSRHSNSPAPSREFNGRDYDSYRAQPMEFREPREPRYTDVPDSQNHERMHDARPQQKLYLEDQRSYDHQAYYMPSQLDARTQYEYAANMRSPSAPSAQYYDGQQQRRRRQPGFVEPEEIFDDPRVPQGVSGGRADILGTLAQEVTQMGLMGGKKGKKDDNDRQIDLLGSLIRK